MKKISSTKAVRTFGECIARVRHTGESILICKNDKPVATLAPAPGTSRLTVAEFIDAWQNLSFDKDFAADLESIGKEDSPLENPWDS
jgi:antitoxin (DNA-binding transcriptional repressor) of toxin-antitoxin stability system